jgi:hypothetical protein
LKSTLAHVRMTFRTATLPDENTLAFDLIGKVGDCKLTGERHSLA